MAASTTGSCAEDCSPLGCVVRVLFSTKEILDWCANTPRPLMPRRNDDYVPKRKVEFALCGIFEKLGNNIVPIPDTNELKEALEKYAGVRIPDNEDPGSLLNYTLNALRYQDTEYA